MVLGEIEVSPEGEAAPDDAYVDAYSADFDGSVVSLLADYLPPPLQRDAGTRWPAPTARPSPPTPATRAPPPARADAGVQVRQGSGPGQRGRSGRIPPTDGWPRRVPAHAGAERPR